MSHYVKSLILDWHSKGLKHLTCISLVAMTNIKVCTCIAPCSSLVRIKEFTIYSILIVDGLLDSNYSLLLFIFDHSNIINSGLVFQTPRHITVHNLCKNCNKAPSRGVAAKCTDNYPLSM